jgi:hypothetical protein
LASNFAIRPAESGSRIRQGAAPMRIILARDALTWLNQPLRWSHGPTLDYLMEKLGGEAWEWSRRPRTPISTVSQALNFLPDEVAGDPQALPRFQTRSSGVPGFPQPVRDRRRCHRRRIEGRRPEGPHPDPRLRSRETRFISVADTGCGIPLNIRDRVP